MSVKHPYKLIDPHTIIVSYYEFIERICEKMKPFEEVYDCDSITLNVSNRCNLSCIYCFEHSKDDSMMSIETAKLIIDKAYRPLTKNKFTINFFGGEPLTNWDMIKQLIEYIDEKQYQVAYGITTNLVLLTDEMVQYIDEYSINVLVSIDGIAESHNRNRNNSYDIVAKNIKRLIDAGCQLLLEGRMTVTPSEAKYMFDGVKNLWDLGINNILPIAVTDTEWSDEELNDYRASYQKILNFYLDRIQDDQENRSIYIKNTDEIIGSVLADSSIGFNMCPINSKRWCAFDTNGDIYRCHQMPYNKELTPPIGNIYTGIWDLEEFDVEKLIPKYDHQECDGCEGIYICKSGCPVENLRENGEMQKPTKAYCEIRKIHVSEIRKKQIDLMSMETIRSRYLNIIKMNLALRKYFDEELLTLDPMTVDFKVKILHLQDQMLWLEENNALLPTFKDYIFLKFSFIYKYMENRIMDLAKEI